jgi:hypothetical protein
MKNSILTFFLFVRYTISKPLWTWNQTTSSYLGTFPKSNHAINYITSACGNGYASSNNLYGFACPHMMMFSEDMLLAARFDRNHNNFYYAVAGSNSDNDAGKCYQVKLLKPELTTTLPPRDLIVQVINSGGDVNFQQFDLMMGAGGFGIYTACNSDCNRRYCSGGACHASLYKGNWNDWTRSQYQNTGDLCYAGGVKWRPPYNQTTLNTMCGNLFRTDSPILFKNVQVNRSCITSNRLNYHQNFQAYRSKQVQCPRGLYQLTGLRRADDTQYALPRIGQTLPDTCDHPTCTTTMMDGCKPSAAWPDKGNPSKDWPNVYTCDKFGFPYL